MQIILAVWILAAAFPQASASKEPLLAMKNGRLTMKVQNQPLDWIFQELTRLSGIRMVRAEDPGDDLISIDIENIPLEEALRQILRNYDFFLFYGHDGEQPAALKTIWVYPKGRGRGLEPITAQQWDTTEEVEAKLEDREPYVRLHAVEVLMQRGGERVKDKVVAALRWEVDEEVRLKMVAAVMGSSLQVPSDLWMTLATTDRSEQIRVLALGALDEHPDLRNIATAALSDPSPSVRSVAQQILDRLDLAARRPSDSQR